jgi:DivIVA domain-containing protein
MARSAVVSLVLLLLAVGVVVAVAAIGAGRVRGGLEEAPTSRPFRPVPEGRIVPSDVDALQFTPALRGYRMDEVDAALASLRDALAERDAELAELRRRAAEPPDDSGGDAPLRPGA